MNLTFSADTIYLDTVFTQTSSSTRVLKAYNKENKWVKIPKVYLGDGSNSNYRLNVDGISGNNFADIEIGPKDSIFIFIETTIDINNENDPLYTDSIVFESDIYRQDVKLVTLVQDAVFLFPPKGTSAFIIKEDVWTSDKPYVIYGYGIVDSAKTLNIEAGANIHFHNSSGLIVYKDASLIANGTLDEKITFQGDRLEPFYEDIAGQWGMIWFYPGSYNSKLEHVVVKNATIGVRIDSMIGNNNTLEILNSEFYNHSSIGILGQGARIKGENIVTNNCGTASVALQYGGDYTFNHCTFANYFKGLRNGPSVFINNYYEDVNGNLNLRDLEKAEFGNCIITGNSSNELVLDLDKNAKHNYLFDHILLKYDEYNNNFYPENDANFINVILNEDEMFWDFSANDLRIEPKSAAADKGSIKIANIVPFDILNNIRNIDGDVELGAFQSEVKP
jgi:hypothetical protein